MSVNLICHFTHESRRKFRFTIKYQTILYTTVVISKPETFTNQFQKFSKRSEHKFLNPFGIISKCLEKISNLLEIFSKHLAKKF